MRNSLSKITSTALIAGIIVFGSTVQTLGSTFADVSTSHTFYTYIESLLKSGVIGGYSDGTFKPENTITRGQMAKFIYNGFALEEDISCTPFTDINPGSTFYTEINSLRCHGIISGYSDETFRPDDPVTRGASMKFVVQGARSAKNDPNFLTGSGTMNFSDLPLTHTFAPYVVSAYLGEIVGGYSDGTFRPDNPVTRGAMSKMVFNTRVKMGITEEVVELPEPTMTGNYEITCEENDGYWLDHSLQCNYIDQNTCESMGGSYGNCGSACGRWNDDPYATCIASCIDACYF